MLVNTIPRDLLRSCLAIQRCTSILGCHRFVIAASLVVPKPVDCTSTDGSHTDDDTKRDADRCTSTE